LYDFVLKALALGGIAIVVIFPFWKSSRGKQRLRTDLSNKPEVDPYVLPRTETWKDIGPNSHQ
jgi:hypothetical protein